MKAVILAGGKGTRLHPYTTILPKPLMPVGNMPILEITLRRLAFFNIKEIYLCVGYLANLIQAYFGDGSKFGIKIHYCFEDKPLGTAGPLFSLKEILQDDCIVMNGDLLTNFNFNKFMKSHTSSGAKISIGAYKKEIKINLGILEFFGDTLINYVEKPILNHWVSMGIYIISPTLLNLIPNHYFDLPDFIKVLIETQTKINTFRDECMWLDIGRKEDYEEANLKYSENMEAFIFEEVVA